jgi:Protein of unknown function (DUF938)
VRSPRRPERSRTAACNNRQYACATSQWRFHSSGLAVSCRKRASSLKSLAAQASTLSNPSDPEPDVVLSVAAWAKAAGVTNVPSPIALDASQSVGRSRRRRDHLHQHDAHLALGGDIRIDEGGRRDTPSRFDRSLRDRNPTWGLRDLVAVAAVARSAGFLVPVITEMPANNLSVVFRRM